MRRLFIILLILISIVIVVVGCRNIRADAQRQNDWQNNKRVITVVINYGDSIDGYWAEYAPSWMGRELYRSEIKKLNNLQNTMLYAGDEIKLYVEGGNQ